MPWDVPFLTSAARRRRRAEGGARPRERHRGARRALRAALRHLHGGGRGLGRGALGAGGPRVWYSGGADCRHRVPGPLRPRAGTTWYELLDIWTRRRRVPDADRRARLQLRAAERRRRALRPQRRGAAPLGGGDAFPRVRAHDALAALRDAVPAPQRHARAGGLRGTPRTSSSTSRGTTGCSKTPRRRRPARASPPTSSRRSAAREAQRARHAAAGALRPPRPEGLRREGRRARRPARASTPPAWRPIRRDLGLRRCRGTRGSRASGTSWATAGTTATSSRSSSPRTSGRTSSRRTAVRARGPDGVEEDARARRRRTPTTSSATCSGGSPPRTPSSARSLATAAKLRGREEARGAGRGRAGKPIECMSVFPSRSRAPPAARRRYRSHLPRRARAALPRFEMLLAWMP